MKVTLDDHSDEVLSALDAAIACGLEKCGLVAEGYAKKSCALLIPATCATASRTR